jgi:hypothetical protein
MKDTKEKGFYESVGAFISDFWQYIVAHWPLLLIAVGTGSFTAHAAWYYTHNPVYVVMAVGLTEGFGLLWIYFSEGAIETGIEDAKLEADELTQIIAAVLGALISICAIILTDYSSAQILATETGVLTAYTAIPEKVQAIIANLVWVLLIANLILMTVYLMASPQAALLRQKNRSKRIMERARISGDIRRENEAAKEYQRLVAENAPRVGKRQGADDFVRSFAHDVATNPEGDDAQENFTPPRSTR